MTDDKMLDYAIINGTWSSFKYFLSFLCEILNLNNVSMHGSMTLGVRTSTVNPNEADPLFDVRPDVLISAHFCVSLKGQVRG